MPPFSKGVLEVTRHKNLIFNVTRKLQKSTARFYAIVITFVIYTYVFWTLLKTSIWFMDKFDYRKKN